MLNYTNLIGVVFNITLSIFQVFFLVFPFWLWTDTGLLIVLSISSDVKEENQLKTLQIISVKLYKKQEFSRINVYMYDQQNSDSHYHSFWPR